MNETKFVEVYSVYGELQAQVIRSKLEAAGIPSLFKNDALGTLGFVMDGLGEFKILVSAKDEQRARAILEQGDAQEGDEQTGQGENNEPS